MTPTLTPEQRANLGKLAAYLRTLPEDYDRFNMAFFTNTRGRAAHIADCGTAACAVGHAPSAGIDPREGENWYSYTDRALTCGDQDVWGWCFSGMWSFTDNTAHGAAARIEWMLEHGVPENQAAQCMGNAPLCYTASTNQ